MSAPQLSSSLLPPSLPLAFKTSVHMTSLMAYGHFLMPPTVDRKWNISSELSLPGSDSQLGRALNLELPLSALLESDPFPWCLRRFSIQYLLCLICSMFNSFLSAPLSPLRACWEWTQPNPGWWWKLVLIPGVLLWKQGRKNSCFWQSHCKAALWLKQAHVAG